MSRVGTEGFPSEAAFVREMNDYINSLSSKKRAKALMTQATYDSIFRVLSSPHDTIIASAQFRFWAKKMFRIVPSETLSFSHFPFRPHPGKWYIVHNNHPVAVREDIYDILVVCHGQCAHGGRDKTASQVRKVFSWIPKDLISRFVRICPSCRAKKARPASNSTCSPSSASSPLNSSVSSASSSTSTTSSSSNAYHAPMPMPSSSVDISSPSSLESTSSPSPPLFHAHQHSDFVYKSAPNYPMNVSTHPITHPSSFLMYPYPPTVSYQPEYPPLYLY